MVKIVDLKNIIEETATLSEIASAYTEMSEMKIKQIRSAYERNARFYIEITYIYQHLMLTAANRNLIPPEGESKVLRVAITSNQRFFGTMNLDVINTFEEDSAKAEKISEATKISEKIVIGATGQEHYEAQNNHSIKEFIRFKNDMPNQDEIKDLLLKLHNYDKVYLYFPRFVTLLRQETGIIDITYKPEAHQMEGIDLDFIFEPELPDILDFFNKQVRTILFNRTMIETDLARTASRMLSMSGAHERAQIQIKNQTRLLDKREKLIRNSQLLEAIAGMQIWHRV